MYSFTKTGPHPQGQTYDTIAHQAAREELEGVYCPDYEFTGIGGGDNVLDSFGDSLQRLARNGAVCE